MHINIRAAGILKAGPERDMVSDYIKRAQGLARSCGFLGVGEQEIDIRSAKTKAQETALILGDTGPGVHIIILDETGKSVKSRAISAQFARIRDEGFSECRLLIGGADGFDKSALPPGVTRWSFGVQTWPHKLVRVMAAEQIYRSLSILAGSPYHRD